MGTGGGSTDMHFYKKHQRLHGEVAFTGTVDFDLIRGAPIDRNKLNLGSKSVKTPANQPSFPLLSYTFFLFFSSGELATSSELHFLRIRSSDKRSPCGMSSLPVLDGQFA